MATNCGNFIAVFMGVLALTGGIGVLGFGGIQPNAEDGKCETLVHRTCMPSGTHCVTDVESCYFSAGVGLSSLDGVNCAYTDVCDVGFGCRDSKCTPKSIGESCTDSLNCTAFDPKKDVNQFVLQGCNQESGKCEILWDTWQGRSHGDACIKDDNCGSDRCVHGVCSGRTKDEVCFEYGCAPGLFCNRFGVNQTCAERLKNGAACSATVQCEVDAVCNGRKCIPMNSIPVSGDCDEPQACAGGLACLAPDAKKPSVTKCTHPEDILKVCTETADCPVTSYGSPVPCECEYDMKGEGEGHCVPSFSVDLKTFDYECLACFEQNCNVGLGDIFTGAQSLIAGTCVSRLCPKRCLCGIYTESANLNSPAFAFLDYSCQGRLIDVINDWTGCGWSHDHWVSSGGHHSSSHKGLPGWAIGLIAGGGSVALILAIIVVIIIVVIIIALLMVTGKAAAAGKSSGVGGDHLLDDEDRMNSENSTLVENEFGGLN